MDDRYHTASRAIRASTPTSSLCLPLQRALGVSDVSIATYGDPFGRSMVCAIGRHALRFGEAQLDHGVGPSWDAYAGGRPVFVPRLRDDARWPGLTSAIDLDRIVSLFAFPMSVGSLGVGALCLTHDEERLLEYDEVEAAAKLSALTAIQVLRRAVAALDTPAPDDATYSLREVHQATGMVMAQLGLPADDALLVLRAHAFALDRSVRETASDIVARKIDLSAELE